MQYALLIYESPETFASRERSEDDAYMGAWRVYYKAMLDAGVYVGGTALHVPHTATTVRQDDGRRDIQDGPYANTKEQLAGFAILELPALDAALDWAARCPAAWAGAVEIRPLADHAMHRITGEHAQS